MRKKSFEAQRASWMFALPGIWPERIRLLLDLQTRTAAVVHLEQGELTPVLRSCRLSPSAVHLFLALLQAYPRHCPYPMLRAALYPGMQADPGLAWEQQIRPIRRDLLTLAPVLRAFGLQAVALRRHGYLLACVQHPIPTVLAASGKGQQKESST